MGRESQTLRSEEQVRASAGKPRWERLHWTPGSQGTPTCPHAHTSSWTLTARTYAHGPALSHTHWPLTHTGVDKPCRRPPCYDAAAGVNMCAKRTFVQRHPRGDMRRPISGAAARPSFKTHAARGTRQGCADRPSWGWTVLGWTRTHSEADVEGLRAGTCDLAQPGGSGALAVHGSVCFPSVQGH